MRRLNSRKTKLQFPQEADRSQNIPLPVHIRSLLYSCGLLGLRLLVWRYCGRRIVLHILLSFLLIIYQTGQLLLQNPSIPFMACTCKSPYRSAQIKGQQRCITVATCCHTLIHCHANVVCAFLYSVTWCSICLMLLEVLSVVGLLVAKAG